MSKLHSQHSKCWAIVRLSLWDLCPRRGCTSAFRASRLIAETDWSFFPALWLFQDRGPKIPELDREALKDDS